MIVEDIIDFLHNNGVGDKDYNILSTGMLNTKPGIEYEHILVRESAGIFMPEVAVNIDYSQLYINVFGNKGYNGEERCFYLAEKAYRTLKLRTNITINGTLYKLIRATQKPFDMEMVNGIAQRQFTVELTRYVEGYNDDRFSNCGTTR